MDYLCWLTGVTAVVGALLSLYWFVELYDRMVRHWRDRYIERGPDASCKRDYAS